MSFCNVPVSVPPFSSPPQFLIQNKTSCCWSVGYLILVFVTSTCAMRAVCECAVFGVINEWITDIIPYKSMYLPTQFQHSLQFSGT